MKKSIILCSLITFGLTYSQVGINTSHPKATFDIQTKNPSGTNAEGILIPRIDRLRAQSMTGIETSTLIYVNNVSTGSAGGTIDTIGFYYYDGAQWVKLKTGSETISDTSIYKSDGALTGDRIVSQNDKTLSFIASSVNAFSIDGTTFSVDAANNKVGFGTTTPEFPVDIVTGRGYGMRHTDGTIELATFLGANDANGNKQAGWLGTKSAHALDLMTSDTPRMTIDATGRVSIGTPTPNASAILELASTNKGFLPPRMTTVQRDAIASKTAGLMIYNTTSKLIQFYNGSAWINYD